jgi:methylmalonyl-CoA mutase N-terminal domain/subunit
MDSDHPLASGEVGRAGVAICSLADMERLFDGIRLADITTSMTINSTASILLSFYVLVARSQGANLRKISGTIQNDILKEYIARGTYIYPPRQAMSIITDLFAWAAIAYIDAALAAGRDVDTFAPRISFFFNSHNNFLEEIAKFRAARRLYASIMRERFAAGNPRSLMMRFHVQTAGSTLTAQQPDVNVVRVSMQALAAVLGGAQSLHTNAKDEALALPTEEAARLALRTQQIIAHESGVTNTADPFVGSYHIEHLTNEIEQGAREYIERIDAMGGTLAAIESGYIQKEVQNAAYAYQQAVERGDAVVVGVNRFKQDEKEPVGMFRLDPELEMQQVARLRELRASRSAAVVQERLHSLEQAARGSDNLMPRILACAEAYATVGEISDRLRGVFGEYHEQ